MKVLLILLLVSLSVAAQAREQRFIHDELRVPLRAGQGNEYRILHRGLPSGSPLTLLEENPDWSRVRTEAGLEGWLETQYLTSQPIARDELERATRELQRLRDANRQLASTLSELRATNASSEDALQELEQENRRLREELEEIQRISGDALRLEEDNRELREASQMLRNQVELLRNDNQRLQNNKENEAFINGAIAVVIGVIIALVVPRLRPRRKSEWA